MLFPSTQVEDEAIVVMSGTWGPSGNTAAPGPVGRTSLSMTSPVQHHCLISEDHEVTQPGVRGMEGRSSRWLPVRHMAEG